MLGHYTTAPGFVFGALGKRWDCFVGRIWIIPEYFCGVKPCGGRILARGRVE